MLSPGDKLGRYEIVSPLGAGGMGEVYRARDAELRRDVAVKVLPAELERDPDRLRRFEREARATAALAHPNVLTVFDVGHEAGRTHLVFELLEGSTLAELMRDGEIDTRDALGYAAQAARGLAAAHARGIVHRDVKPANLLLTAAGIVKILDFGLARIGGVTAWDAEETTAEVTGPGAVLGTVSYMSPEQARGQAVDGRSDLFSLGVVLYEMLSGQHPFRRQSSAETVSAILRDQPPALVASRGRVALPLERLVGRCLEKRPEDRFQTASDLAAALELLDPEGPAPAARPSAHASASPPGAEPRPIGSRRRRAVALGAALVLALGLATTAWRLAARRGATPSTPRLIPLTSTPGDERYPTVAPDGQQLAFSWGGEGSDNWDIYVKMIGSPELRRLTTDKAPDGYPSWSPDARQIAFMRFAPGGSALHVVSPLGGAERKLRALVASGPLSWSPDSRSLAIPWTFYAADSGTVGRRGIGLVEVPGGEVRTITSPIAPTWHRTPAFSPDGRSLAYVSCVGWYACHLEVVALGPDVMPRGKPRRLTRKAAWIGGLAWVRDGLSLIYTAGSPTRLWRVGVDGDRAAEAIDVAGYGVSDPSLAGSRLVFSRLLSHRDVHRYQPGSASKAVAASTLDDRNPQLSPNGERFAFESSRSGEGMDVWLAGTDGANPSQLTRGPGIWQGSPRWSPDGRRIAFDSVAEDGNSDIWTIDADGGGLRRLTSDPADDNMPSWSRDGRVVYFTSNRTGSYRVFRVPAEGGPEQRLTAEGGGPPFESWDGKALFYSREFVGSSPLMTVPLAGGPERTLVDCVSLWGYAVAAAGVYYQGCGSQPRAVPVYLRDLASGRDRRVGTLTGWSAGFTVSADGNTLLYTKVVGEGSDLMLIEDFR